MLCQKFPAVDQSLGALATAKNVTDQMKKTYEDLSEIDWDNLEYDAEVVISVTRNAWGWGSGSSFQTNSMNTAFRFCDTGE